MASNGTSTANGETSDIAAQMQRLHTEGHKPTVEDIVDEEDIAHPPPSAELSEKAKGKQPVKENSKPAAAKLDTSNEEAFPALGAGPKKAAAGAWGGGKPASMAGNGAARGPPSAIPARQSAPSAATRQNVGINLPGKQQQTLELRTTQMLAPGERKKPIERLLADIEKKVGVKLEQRPTAYGLQFIATGRPEKLSNALQAVAKELGSRQVTSVPVPVSVKPHLIGKGGINIKKIQEQTGARIQVPKTEASSQPLGDDDDATIDVTIEGDAVAAEQARQMVEKIINERTSTLGTRLREVPPELFSFLAGPRNANIAGLTEGRNVDIKIPQYLTRHSAAPQLVRGQPMQFANHPSSHIQLSGDRQDVQQARLEIERRAAELRRNLIFEESSIPRGQHQLIFDADSLHEFLEHTGCTVIMPHENDDSEIIHVVGPASRIEAGRDRLDELAGSMSSQFVDLSRAHPNASEAYRRNLARYLQQRSALRDFENRHNSKVALPRDSSSAWELYARNSKDLMNARRELSSIIDAHPPQRFLPLELDPFFHQHLRAEHAKRLRHDHGVHMLFPEDGSESLVLVFEQEGAPPTEFVPPKQKPAAADVKAFQEALQAVQREILGLSQQHGPIQSRGLDVPRQYQEKVRKFVSRQQQDLPQGSLPLQFVPQSQQSPQVSIRGPQARLDPFTASILEFIEQEKRDEKERGYTTSFDFPQKFANHLIGRGGEGINKLREEFDVEIQVRDGKVELKGPQAKCAACQQRVLNIGKRLEDETTHVIKVPRSYHPELIGAKGSSANRLQDRYKVRIQFPRGGAGRDDESVADDSRSRSNQAPDEIQIRGPSKGADDARDELLSLFQYLRDNSHTATVSVAKAQLPSIIGAGGREIESIRQETGAKIDVPKKDEVGADGRVEITLKGKKDQVENAKKRLSERAKDFDGRVSHTIDVPKEYLQGLIGSGGNNIRGILIKAGVAEDRQEQARAVRFPDAKSDSTEVRIEQKKEVADKIVKAIREYVEARQNQVTDAVEVPVAQHRLLIGQQGQTRRKLEEDLGVKIDIPRQGSGSTAVQIAGLPDKVTKAKEHIANMVKQESGVEVAVPRHLHHVIADNGRFFGRLRNHGVRVDHARPPPKPEATKPKGRSANASAMPLITDDASNGAEAGHSWEIVDAYPAPAAEPAHIAWILRGKEEDVAKARQQISDAIAAAEEQDSAGYLVLGDPSLHKLVIGQGGATINSIRNETGCKITVPKSNGADEAIEILGRKQGVEAAKERILEAVAKGGRGRRGD